MRPELKWTTLLFLAGAIILLPACGDPTQAQIDEAVRQAQEEAAAQEEEPVGPPPGEVALEILQRCALNDVGRLLGLLDVFGPLLDPTATFPAFVLDRVDTTGQGIHWKLDTNGDGTLDMNGAFRFEDPSGGTALPFTEEELLALEETGNLDALPGLLANLPEGSILYLQFTQSGSAEVSGLLGITFLQGMDMLAGTVNVLALECTTAFRIRGVSAEDLAGAYPRTELPLTVASAQGLLVGSVIMDGTPLAVVRVTYDSTPLEFVIDLENGTIQEQPVPSTE